MTTSAEALAFWVREPGVGEVRAAALPAPREGEVVVRALWSGISRGTESLVFQGRVPPSQYDVMRAPHQEGEFPGPLKYGYLNVGVVEHGPDDLRDRTVFCLYPHQSRYAVAADAVIPVPTGVPARRAVLAGTVETAVNALWDVPPLLGDRVVVLGAGMVGCCLARLLAQVPGIEVTLVDVDETRRDIGVALGVRFTTPALAPTELDLVYDTTGSPGGLRRALELLAPEGTVVLLSWLGDTEVALPLGAAFHSRRLTIRSSQVGAVGTARRDRRTMSQRLTLALELLQDNAFDALLTGSCQLDELPRVMPALVDGSLTAVCHTVAYPEE